MPNLLSGHRSVLRSPARTARRRRSRPAWTAQAALQCASRQAPPPARGRTRPAASVAVAKTFGRLLRFGGARAIRTEVPARLQRAAAVRTAAAQPLAALRAREKVDADRRAAPGAQRPHLPHFGDDAQQLLGRGDA